jgi:hypothetical protein
MREACVLGKGFVTGCDIAVGHRKRCDKTAFHKMCIVTHSLLVIGKDVMRSFFEPLNQHGMLLTFYVYRNRCDLTAFHKTCNITHNL